MNVKAPLFRVAVATAIASLSFSMLVPAANAAEDRIHVVVEAAERALGINDDDVDDKVVVLSGGEQTTLEGSTQNLEVTVGDESDESSDITYTADTLDESTVRFAAVHESVESNTASWDFGKNSTLILLNDGRATVSDEEGNLIAGIEAPWAVDANGKKLETYYSADGSKLVQNVVFTDDTKFPVVADPKLSMAPYTPPLPSISLKALRWWEPWLDARLS